MQTLSCHFEYLFLIIMLSQYLTTYHFICRQIPLVVYSDTNYSLRQLLEVDDKPFQFFFSNTLFLYCLIEVNGTNL